MEGKGRVEKGKGGWQGSKGRREGGREGAREGGKERKREGGRKGERGNTCVYSERRRVRRTCRKDVLKMHV